MVFQLRLEQHCLCTASFILARTALDLLVDDEGAAQEGVGAIPKVDQVLFAIVAPAGPEGTIRNSRTGNLILYKAGTIKETRRPDGFPMSTSEMRHTEHQTPRFKITNVEPRNANSSDLYLFFVCLYEKRFRVLSHCQRSLRSTLKRPKTYGENSPSLCPTISSVILTSWYILPLYTWKIRPTKLGSMVAARAWVLIGGTRSPGFGRTMGSLTMSVLVLRGFTNCEAP